MKIRFWGVRGSIPSPGPQTVRYGGNTTCIEVRSDAGELIILDAGTGIFPLSQSLFPEFPLQAHIFNTHTHWDHIQGLPFFIPFFVPGNQVNIYGVSDPVSQKGISEILTTQLQYRFFPIREAELKAKVIYQSLVEAQKIQVGDAVITPVLMNHPVTNFGYRIDCNDKSMFFTGDHEPASNIYESEDEEYEEYQTLIDEKNQSIIDAIQGVDVMISDASYTPEEYPAKKGWGHGTYDTGMAMARDAGVGKLYCTHHEPTRSDDALETVFAEALERNPRKEGDPEYLLAQEGLEIEW
ncbi:MAG: MBL fold metallo-hydrolase [Mariprofundaceae bacterium]|nr:MBL fold metallo-hydrolase [Mariprofundaceae bacterium]